MFTYNVLLNMLKATLGFISYKIILSQILKLKFTFQKGKVPILGKKKENQLHN